MSDSNDITCANCDWVGLLDDTIITNDDRGSVCPVCGSADLVDYDPRDARGLD